MTARLATRQESQQILARIDKRIDKLYAKMEFAKFTERIVEAAMYAHDIFDHMEARMKLKQFISSLPPDEPEEYVVIPMYGFGPHGL